MTNWLPRPGTLKRPVYQALVAHISQAVADGRLVPGTRLPTHRQLAHELAVSVQTVSRAYDELIRRGLIIGEVGRGTFVRQDRPPPAPPFILERGGGDLIDLSILKPVGDPLHAERMKAALVDVAADPPLSALFSFRPSLGQRRYREIAVDWLKVCGVEAQSNQIHVTNGATVALMVALLSATRPGDAIAAEAIGHHTLLPLCDYLGRRLVGLEIDEDGIRPEALAEAAESKKIKALFVVPSAANPTVSMVSLGRRQELVEVARKADIQIIENDAWGPLVEGRPAPFASLAPERTFYATSFTKFTLPGLRVGYLVAPNLLTSAAANRHLVTNWSATSIMAEIASRWVTNGTASELLLWQREALAARHAVTRAALEGVPYRQHRHSLHIWLPLPSAWREEEFVAQARLHDVAIAPGASFAVSSSVTTQAVRVSVGSTSATELRQGLEVLARLARGAPEPALLVI